MEGQPDQRLPITSWDFWNSVFAAWLFYIFTALIFTASVPAQNLYGSWLFFLSPLIAGMVSGATANFRRQTTGMAAWLVTLVSLLGVGGAMLFLMAEGVICMIMAFPLVYPTQTLGYVIGRGLMTVALQRKRPFMIAVFPLFLFGMLHSAYQLPKPQARIQTTTMVVDAPPEEIWPMLFNLNDIPESEFWMFRMGVGHTLGVRSHGEYLGASRECLLSSGTMPEIISIYEPHRKLRFTVLETPPPMKEINPFGPVHAPHLSGYYSVDYGEIELEPLPDGRTRLIGTSKYAYQLYPPEYWNLWTDLVSDQIHLRVFGEMKRRAEGED